MRYLYFKCCNHVYFTVSSSQCVVSGEETKQDDDFNLDNLTGDWRIFVSTKEGQQCQINCIASIKAIMNE